MPLQASDASLRSEKATERSNPEALVPLIPRPILP